MSHFLSAVTFFVDDYDIAIDYFTQVLNFTLSEDKSSGDGSRFVLLTPEKNEQRSAHSLLLAEANSAEEKALVGRQAADKVFLILSTDDFWRDYRRLQQRGVTVLETPREEAYGVVAIFKDRYGNKWDLIQPSDME